jgi:hypothetical protein
MFQHEDFRQKEDTSAASNSFCSLFTGVLYRQSVVHGGLMSCLLLTQTACTEPASCGQKQASRARIRREDHEQQNYSAVDVFLSFFGSRHL